MSSHPKLNFRLPPGGIGLDRKKLKRHPVQPINCQTFINPYRLQPASPINLPTFQLIRASEAPDLQCQSRTKEMKKIIKRGLIIIALSLIAFYAFWQISKARTFQLLGEIVPRVETQEKIVALTFDDGPTPEATDEILAILKAHQVKATFFLTGAEIEKSPESANQIVAAGHEVGNHSYSHERMFFKTPSFIQREIDDTDKLIREAGYTGGSAFFSPVSHVDTCLSLD